MEFWSNLFSGVEIVFYGIAIVSSLLLVLQMVFSLIGGIGNHDLGGLDHGGDLSLDHGGLDHGGGVVEHGGPGVISVRTVLAFFVGFGWGGVVLLRAGAGLLVTLFGATMIGMVFLLVVFFFAVQIYRLSESGNVDYRNALGQSGTVYLPIPAQGGGKGQIQVVVQSRLREMPAVTDAAEPLPTGARIHVVKVLEDGTALVRRASMD